ncbi:conserved hypothetical protein [Methylobacterium sp. 4-46]|uniref:hypothetical protein n=1 Tax=unclassified Methylobacterium TaxID=2615210 RepID=UPI000165CDFE|nr:MULTISPECIES: hypothetical protein [Methylobacterium]ACA19506.1 conserved hypothetical protein [Methylobacterium sp. 4-46]WFT78702.1 hypothetical protein QA634_26060 [Methylobacterium nodulans]
MRALLGARLTLLAALIAGACLGAGPGLAAPAVDKAPKAQGRSAAVRDVTVTATAPEEGADDATCTTSRKRLFVEGEGWIVRRVTTCR